MTNPVHYDLVAMERACRASMATTINAARQRAARPLDRQYVEAQAVLAELTVIATAARARLLNEEMPPRIIIGSFGNMLGAIAGSLINASENTEVAIDLLMKQFERSFNAIAGGERDAMAEYGHVPFSPREGGRA